MANREDKIQNQMKWLDYIRIGTDRMAKLVNDLLTLARTEDAHTPLRKVPFSISKEIDDVICSIPCTSSNSKSTAPANDNPVCNQQYNQRTLSDL